MVTILDSIKQRQAELGISNNEVARRAGLSEQYVQRIMRGIHTNCSFETVSKLLDGLDLKLVCLTKHQAGDLSDALTK